MIPSRTLSDEDASIALALIRRGMPQHDVASLLAVNPGRIAEISTRQRHRNAAPASLADPAVRARILSLRDDTTRRFNRLVSLALNPQLERRTP